MQLMKEEFISVLTHMHNERNLIRKIKKISYNSLPYEFHDGASAESTPKLRWKIAVLAYRKITGECGNNITPHLLCESSYDVWLGRFL
jgi:hypothetical protein